VLIRALVADLILNKDEALIMDMEAGLEHLGRATTSGVDRMLVVVEPGQRSLEGARRIVEMANQIGLKHLQFVANKIDGSEDEEFVRAALEDAEILEFIPFADDIRRADRPGRSVLDLIDSGMLARFERILDLVDTDHAAEA
jgi:CO dehydrogenase maturation factor